MQAGTAYMERSNRVANMVYRNICAEHRLEDSTTEYTVCLKIQPKFNNSPKVFIRMFALEHRYSLRSSSSFNWWLAW